MSEVSHNEIYERLIAVESKVDTVSKDTKDVVEAFHAAQGAFTALEWIGKIIKPLIIVGTFLAAIGTYWSQK